MKPILFNTEMVRAILDDRKTVTRRLIKPQPTYNESGGFAWKGSEYGTDIPPTIQGAVNNFQCAFPYKIGDILYVRETWKIFRGMIYGWENGAYIPLDDFEGYKYKSDEHCFCTKGINPFCDGFEDQKQDISFDDKWRPSIHMPKEAARIFLGVTGVRVERLQDCGNAQAKDEGCTCCSQFARIWDSTIKKSDLAKYGWEANPWVYVIEFEKISREEAENG